MTILKARTEMTILKARTDMTIVKARTEMTILKARTYQTTNMTLQNAGRQTAQHHHDFLHDADFVSASSCARALQAGADPNVRDVDGWTALHNSARNGRNRCAQALLFHRADMTLTTRYGETPLHVASRKGKAKVAAEIVACAETAELLESLLEHKDSDGRTPMDVAASDHIRSILRGEAVEGFSQYDFMRDGANIKQTMVSRRFNGSMIARRKQTRMCTLM
jgi:hypothetical protein